jgi:large subunit ribosomal protein L29
MDQERETMKAAKYREMSLDELEDQVHQIRAEIFNLRVGNTTKELQDTSKIAQTRRELARVLTVIGERSGETTGGQA